MSKTLPYILYAITTGFFISSATGSPGPVSGMEFITIPSGEFMMGSPSAAEDREIDEGPRRLVTIDSFELMSTEVTQGIWEEVMGNNPSCDYGLGPNYPVYNVSWDDCQDFIEIINNLDLSHTYRLPSEAEWEYACRAGTNEAFYWGSSSYESIVSNYCWYLENSNSSTHLVGTKTANSWGLYDMSGNIGEWCQDIYTSDYNSCPSDGTPYCALGELRGYRGGHSYHSAINCRSAARNSASPSSRTRYRGLRLARSAPYTRFTESNGIITDNNTNLLWQVGPDSNTNYYHANIWVDRLGGSWRMPSLEELTALYTAGINCRDWGYFQNTGGSVWSSFHHQYYDPTWCVSFGSGENYSTLPTNPAGKRVFAVSPATNGTSAPGLE